MDGSTIIRELINEIWNRKQIGRIYDAYQHNAVLHSSDGDLYGREAILRAIIWRLAALPDARVEIEEVIASGDRVSVRWTLAGRNTGHSIYGPPTGRETGSRRAKNLALNCSCWAASARSSNALRIMALLFA